jgi:hypothetical protein
MVTRRSKIVNSRDDFTPTSRKIAKARQHQRAGGTELVRRERQ